MESFDKKIKEKLEQIPDVNPEMAWTRFAQSLPKPWYTTFLSKYAGWGFATLVTVVLLSQQVKIAELEKKIQASTTQNLKNEAIIVQKQTDLKNSYRNETFKNPDYQQTEIPIANSENIDLNNFPVKKPVLKLTEKQLISSKPLSGEASKVKNSKTTILTKGNVEIVKKTDTINTTENKLMAKHLGQETEKEEVKSVKGEVSGINNMPNDISIETVAIQNSKEKIIIEETQTTETPVVIQNSSEKANQNITPAPEKIGNTAREGKLVASTPSKDANIQIANTTEIKAIQVESIVKDTETLEKLAEKTDPLNPEKLNTKGIDFKPKLHISKKLNVRMGLETQVLLNGKTSLGPISEFMIGSKFSISSGILFSSNNSHAFKQPQEFNKRTGRRFEDFYKPYLGDKQREIKNIEIRTSAILVPLKVSYYYPLKNNFSIFGTAGAAFRIIEKDDVVFEGKLPLEESIISTFENRKSSKPLSSFSYGMGVQYAYKRLFLQVQPSFNFSTQKSFLLKERNRLGLDASLRFSLRK